MCATCPCLAPRASALPVDATSHFTASLKSLDQRLRALEALPRESDRKAAVDAVRAVLLLHGEVLEHLLELVAGVTQGREPLESIADDPRVRGLLLLHGIHPKPLGERVEEALEAVRPYLDSHGGSIQLLGVVDGVARLRLEGSCRTCPSSAATLKYAVEDALQAYAPDLVDTELESPAAPGDAFIPLTTVHASGTGANGSDWQAAARLHELTESVPTVVRVGELAVLLVRFRGGCWAYEAECAACAANLDSAVLEGPRLTCGNCASSWALDRGGRPEGAGGPALRPFPLRLSGGTVQVARRALVA